jgi:uncharacterized protein (TIGR01244 family)
MRIVYVLGMMALAAAGLTAQQKQERAGITNFTKVDAVIACGGATEVSALDGLKQDGFKTVINLRMASEQGAHIDENKAKAASLGLNYVHIPFSGSTPDPKAVDQFLATIADKTNQPVFVHCASASRVGAMWMVKRTLQDGWPVEKAADEAKMIGLRSAPLEQFARDYIASHK